MILLLALIGCNKDETLSFEALLDPAVCADCHPDHYAEWSGSMHAYASDDPLFLAMNARGQEEADIGTFCVQCHAPMAVELGETDGTDVASLPAELKGITCTYCHQVTAVKGTHNNPLRIARDSTLRGPLRDAVDPGVHGVAYSRLHDREALASADLCGSCHDIVTPLGAHIERTYSEWQNSLYSDPDGAFGLTCGGCHMRGREGTAASFEGVPLRRVHSHTFAGVDLALTPFPEQEAQRTEVQALLDSSLLAQVCAVPGTDPTTVVVELENVAAGHMFPSGAAADRRVWVEVEAWDGDTVAWASGAVPEGEAVLSHDDPTMWTLNDTLLDSDGRPTHLFWEAADYRTELLPAPTAASEANPAWIDTHVQRTYEVAGFVPTKITLRVRMRPFGLDVVDELTSGGHLDPVYRARIETFTLAATELTWTPDAPVRETDGRACVPVL